MLGSIGVTGVTGGVMTTAAGGVTGATATAGVDEPACAPVAAWAVTVVAFTVAPALVAPLLAPAAALPAMIAASAVDLPALAACAAPCAALAAMVVPTLVAEIPEEPADATTPEVAPVAAELEAAVAIA